MKIISLYYVLMVERCGSLNKAAEKLYISQPNLSFAISSLEKELGVRLFARTTKEVKPTRAGETFVTYARDMLTLRDSAAAALGDFEKAVEGGVMIGASSIPEKYFLPEIMAAFNERYPQVSFQVYAGDSERVIARLAAGELDFVIGTHALSSVLIRPADEGEGLNVTTYNISYCTIDMYTNALLTAGLQDANVYVAAPSNISGTSALIGAVKGYAEMNGSKVDEQALETAVNELVVTGDLGTSLGDSETASDMVAYIKQQILENNVSSDADIEKIIRDAMEKFDIKLSDDQIQQLIDLMHKISKLDIDVDALAKQAGEIYNKLKDMGLDLSKVDTKQVGNFITRFFDRIMSLVNQFIG